MAAETGTPNGKVGKSRCEGCSSPRREELDAALISPTSTLAELVSRFGGSTSALSRHRRHVARGIVRAVARIVAPPPEVHEIEVYENARLREITQAKVEARALFETLRASGDTRGAVVAHKNILDVMRFEHELFPASAAPEVVQVVFSFPSSGAQRDAEFFGPRGAATASEAAGPASAMPGDDRDA